LRARRLQHAGRRWRRTCSTRAFCLQLALGAGQLRRDLPLRLGHEREAARPGSAMRLALRARAWRWRVDLRISVCRLLKAACAALGLGASLGDEAFFCTSADCLRPMLSR
jgi:hypothetical protein